MVLALTVVWAATRGMDDVDLEATGLYWGIASSVVAIAGVAVVAWNAPGDTEPISRLLRAGMAMGWVAALGGAQLIVLVVPIAAVWDNLAFVPFGSAIACGLGGLALIVVALFAIAAWAVWGGLEGESVLERASMGLILLMVIVIGVALGFGSDFKAHGRISVVSGTLALLGVVGHTTNETWMTIARIAAVSMVALLVILIRAVRQKAASAR